MVCLVTRDICKLANFWHHLCKVIATDWNAIVPHRYLVCGCATIWFFHGTYIKQIYPWPQKAVCWCTSLIFYSGNDLQLQDFCISQHICSWGVTERDHRSSFSINFQYTYTHSQSAEFEIIWDPCVHYHLSNRNFSHFQKIQHARDFWDYLYRAHHSPRVYSPP